MIDIDGSGSITIDEFKEFGFIFNISAKVRSSRKPTQPFVAAECLVCSWQASHHAFKEFDVDNSKELDYEEFRMFCLVCLDKQNDIEQKRTIRSPIAVRDPAVLMMQDGDKHH